MREPILVIMAAGLGERFGGDKQIEKVTPEGEIILDFSLYDAYKAGFRKVILVIREEHLDIFQKSMDKREGKYMDISYAFQKIDDFPGEVPAGRTKPWGTAHAIYACRDMIDSPFAVINADDYYGASGFSMAYTFLASSRRDKDTLCCNIGYILKNTLSENGPVTRGVCLLGEHRDLIQITEKEGITTELEGFNGFETVSMNFWGFPRKMVDFIESAMVEFAQRRGDKDECLLPEVVDSLLQRGEIGVKVLPCDEKWCGVTYREDKESVSKLLAKKKNDMLYPRRLWAY